jgi:hypothetical protein
MTLNKKSFIASMLLALVSLNVYAAKSTFNEEEFLRNFNGKSNKVILEKLGTPDKKEQSVKCQCNDCRQG